MFKFSLPYSSNFMVMRNLLEVISLLWFLTKKVLLMCYSFGHVQKLFEKGDSLKNLSQVADCTINKNLNIWKVFLGRTGDNQIRTRMFRTQLYSLRVGWDSYGKNITDENDFSSNVDMQYHNWCLFFMQTNQEKRI